MAKCNHCDKMILFGAKKLDEIRFCSDACLEQGYLQLEARAIPDDIVFEATREIHMGLCPVCGGSGPIGLFVTPLQICKNIAGLAKPPDPLRPSDEMPSMVRLNIAESLILDEQEKLEADA